MKAGRREGGGTGAERRRGSHSDPGERLCPRLEGTPARFC